MIDFQFTLTQAEYIEAQKLYMSSNKSWKRLRIILMGVLLLSFTVLLLSLRSGTGAVAFQQLKALIILMVFLFFVPLLQRFGFRKRFLKERKNLTNVTVIIDEVGFHSDIPGIGGGVAEWAGMDGWQEGKKVIMLRSGLLMRLFPKSSLSETEMVDVRKLLARKLGPVGVMRKH